MNGHSQHRRRQIMLWYIAGGLALLGIGYGIGWSNRRGMDIDALRKAGIL